MDKGIEALITKMLEQTKRFDNVHITESEAKQLITELQRLDGRNANLNSTLESWATDRAESAQRISELESQPLCVKSNDAMREVAPLCVKLPTTATTFDAAAAIRACMDEFPLAVQDIVEECAVIAENTIRAAGGTVEGSE